MKFDKLNILEDYDYFEPMAISVEDKAKRRELCDYLTDAFLYFFSVYEVHRIYDSMLSRALYEQLLADHISDAISKVTGIDSEISKHIRNLAKEVVNTTIKQVSQSPPDYDALSSDLDTAEESLDFPLTTSGDSHIQNKDAISVEDDEVEEIIEQEERKNYWLSLKRAVLIAQNETNGIMNYDAYVAAKDKGLKWKTWHTMLDNKVREEHQELEGLTIPIEQPFTVGNSLMQFAHDFDIDVDPKEVINCRCSIEYK